MAETEIKSINGKTLADATAREKKLDKNQGVKNAGKILGIGADGNVTPQNKPVQAIAGPAAPTTATAGVVGQEYYVIVNNAVTEMYVCTAVANGTYTWDKVEFGGGNTTGVSLGITGATVGQIAKITAVDSAGKPTAWEPVDIPKEIEWVNATLTFDDNGNSSISTDISATEVIRRIKEGRCCVVRLIDGDYELTMFQSFCDESGANFITTFNNTIYTLNFSIYNGSDDVYLNTSSIGSEIFDLERNSDDPTKATFMDGATVDDVYEAIGLGTPVYLRIGENVYSWSVSASNERFSTIIEDGNELKYSRITLGEDGNPYSTNATIYEKVL